MSVKKKKKKIKLTETGSAKTSGPKGGDGDSMVESTRTSKENQAAKPISKIPLILGAQSKKQAKSKPSMDKEEPKKQPKKEEKSSPADSIRSSVIFLKDVWKEARKITWPPRRQVVQETWSVLVLVAFITVLVLGYDYALGHWVFGPIEHFSKMNAPAETKPFETTTPSPIDHSNEPGLPFAPMSVPSKRPAEMPANPLEGKVAGKEAPGIPVPAPGGTTAPDTKGTTPAPTPPSNTNSPAGTGVPSSSTPTNTPTNQK